MEEITIEWLENEFNKFNKLYFNGELPLPHFVIFHPKTTLGQFQPCMRLTPFGNPIGAPIIRISNYFIRPIKEIQTTLIHEMIHYFIHFKGIEDTSSHGKKWKELAAQINVKGNWSITRTTSVVGCKVNERFVRNKKKLEK